MSSSPPLPPPPLATQDRAQVARAAATLFDCLKGNSLGAGLDFVEAVQPGQLRTFDAAGMFVGAGN